MKKIYLLISILLSLLQMHAQQYVLIQFSSQENIPKDEYSDSDSSYSLECSDDELTKLFEYYKVTTFQKEYPNAHLVSHSNAELLDRVYRIETTDSISSLYNKLQILGSSIIQGPIYLVNQPELLVVPDDYNLICFSPLYNCGVARCSNLQNDLINAKDAWDITTGNTNIRIAMTDENFRRTQEDLVGKIVIDNAVPWTSTLGSHGTATSVLAAGNTNNGVGIASIGYNCKLDLYDYWGGVNNILTAAINGARVVNCSWYNSCSPISYDQALIDMVYETYHTVIVAAAGNGNSTSCGITGDYYPASYNHVISVTAVGHVADISSIGTCSGYDYKDMHDFYLNNNPPYVFTHNSNVDLCAPGYEVTIPRTNLNDPDHQYQGGYGTSFSSPMVAGTAALLLSVNSSFNSDDVEAIMKCTARDLYEIPYNINYLNLLGSGRIDAGKAVQLAQTWTPGTGATQQTAPTDIRWFEILSNGTTTMEVEAATCSSNTSGYCNIGFRLEVVSGNPNLSFKWLNFYSESGVYITNSIKYGNSIYLTRGIDYPMTDVTGGSLKICVRVNDCISSLYYSEDRASSCFGPACTYPCPSDIYITGNYSTALTESYTWIKSVGQTTIPASISVKLDASPTSGFVEIKPVSSSDYFLSEPNSTGVFIVEAYNGCTSGEPSFTDNMPSNTENRQEKLKEESKLSGRNYSVFPNPGTGLFTLKHPAGLKEISVIDIYGKIILKMTNTGNKETRINLSNMPSGIYMLRAVGTTYVTKIIKQ